MSAIEHPNQHPLIAEAITMCGSQARLAAAAGVEQQTISKLLNRERRVTAEMAVAIDRATGGRIARHQLRPDLFDASDVSPPSSLVSASTTEVAGEGRR